MNIWEIALSCIVSAGGVGGIILLVIKLFINMITDRLSAKYEEKLRMELEKYKTELGKKEYISKTRFDTEFSIYKDLCCSFSKLVNYMNDISFWFVSASDDKDIKMIENVFNETQEKIDANSVFILQDFSEEFNDILKDCRLLINCYSDYKNTNKYLREDTYRVQGIQRKWDELKKQMRDYLSTLEVL